MTRTICVVTTSRADYGLLYWLMREIADDPGLRLQVVATGMHLSPEFGLTVREIERDGFTPDDTIEMLLSADTPSAVAKAVGLGVISFADSLRRLKPDILVGLGDRFELFAAVTAAMIARIPVAHLHGGESTEGAIDESIRHSITKMSHLHFTAAEPYRKRVIQLGEHPERVFTVGAFGLDNIARLPLLGREEIERALGFSFLPRNALVTFHPVTLEKETSEAQCGELMAALEDTGGLGIIWTRPNADTEGRIINRLIDEFVARHPQRSAAFTSLGTRHYLSVLKHVDCVIGNSSSGLIEAPSLRTATINIGDRQRGRLRAASVVDCRPEREDIRAAIEKIRAPAFRELVSAADNPYGTAGAAVRTWEVLRTYPLQGILKKSFHVVEAIP